MSLRARQLATAGIGTLVFLAALALVERGAVPGVDGQVLSWCADLRSRSGVDVARVLTWLGAAPVAWPAVALAAVAVGRAGRRGDAAALVAGLVMTIVLVHLVKVGVDRARPPHPLTSAQGRSFPSGHTAYATAMAAAAGALWGRGPHRRPGLVAAAVATAVVVGLTRIYLRAHYLTDVAGGAGLTVAVVALCAALGPAVAGVRKNGGQ